jgi:hypothetical protein
MGRTIAGVVVGYIVMALVVFAVFSVAYLGMGADRAFQPGSYAPSGLWIVVSLIVGFGAAAAGGWVCASIARNPRAVTALAALVIVLGIVFAVPVMTRKEGPGPRTDTVGNMQAMQQAQTPLWLALLNPLIGVVGVMVGGRRRLGPVRGGPPQI